MNCQTLNSLVCECEFPDETTKEYVANIIAEESDLQGYKRKLMTGIIDHNGDAIKKSMYIKSKYGQNGNFQSNITVVPGNGWT